QGYSELKVYKYNAEQGKYLEVSFTVKDGKVILTLTPGDPIFAVVAKEGGPLGGLPGATGAGGLPLLPLLLLALLVAAAGIVVVMRRRK
ncbi:MAG: hypothetical protein ABDH61_02985, partial [Acidilobaceae archaeon]